MTDQPCGSEMDDGGSLKQSVLLMDITESVSKTSYPFILEKEKKDDDEEEMEGKGYANQ